MNEYSRILIEEYCMTHNYAKSRRLAKLVAKSYDLSAEDPDTCERPVALGFSPEERAWTKEERTPEERLDEEQTVDFLLEDERQINGQEALKHPDRLKGALTRTDGRKGTIAFLAYDEDIYQAENALLCDIYEEFFRQADVKTVKELAKVLNKGWKLHLDRKSR